MVPYLEEARGVWVGLGPFGRSERVMSFSQGELKLYQPIR